MHSQSPSIRDSANLDFLRSVAVSLVFCVHLYDLSTGTGKNWGFVWHIGQLGVLMFFVHTCLVLMWSLERSALSGWRLFMAFYVRRAFRLYPLSIACVVFAYFFDSQWHPVNLWQNLTLTQYLFFVNHPVFPPSVTPLWTLPLELQMYIVLPVLFLLFRNKNLQSLLELWAVSVAVSFVQPQLGDRFLVLRFVPCFLGGVIAWRLMRERDIRRLSAWLWPVLMAAASLTWIVASGKFVPIGIAAFGLCLGLSIALVREIQWPRIAAASKIFARYSYGIYLVHFPIILLVLRNPLLHRIKHHARPLDLSVILILTSATVAVLYRFVEEPGIRLGQKAARWLTSLHEDEIQSPVASGH